VYSKPILLGWQIKQDVMDGVCNTHGIYVVQNRVKVYISFEDGNK
jgi:hypothetical protein